MEAVYEMIDLLARAFVRGAATTVIDVDEFARFIVWDPEARKIMEVMVAAPGDIVFVSRACRLLVEPLASVTSRDPVRGGTWWTS